ncbi:MAG: hypothetical protein ACP5QZ_02110 [Candidatus Sumerlaeaceae bacterium]
MLRREKHVTCRSVGSPVNIVAVHSAKFSSARHPQYLYVVQRGLPAVLSVIKLPTKNIVAQHQLVEAEGAENILLAATKQLYIPTHPHGKLYRFSSADNRLEEIPTPLTSPAFLWDATEADDGTIYVGCWPQSRLLVYGPTGKLVDLGSAAAPEDYIRALRYSPFTRRLYLGIGAHAALLEYEPATRTKRNLLPAELQTEHFVLRLALHDRWLFARTTPREKTVVFDLANDGTLVAEFDPLDCTDVVALASQPDILLLGAKGHLVAYNTAERKAHVPEAPLAQIIRAIALEESPSSSEVALAVCSTGTLHRVTQSGQQLETFALDLPPQPIVLQNVAAGPDARIYTNGYVTGGVGVFDPATGETRFFGNVNQAESITHDGHCIYFGTYPHARIVRYDPHAPPSANNPREILCLAPWNQDRPYAMWADPQRRKLFIGCVPAYGCLGGTLAVYDLDTEHARVYSDLIPQQSIVALASDGQLLYGATSTSGGLGVQPRATSAELFAFHPDMETLLYRVMPINNVRGITGLVCDSRGILYGWAEGTLFAFDPQERRLLWRELVFEHTYPADHYWRGIVMRYSLTEKDVFYGAAWGIIFQFDARRETFTILARIVGAEVVAAGHDGNLYAIAGSELFQVLTANSPQDTVV